MQCPNCNKVIPDTANVCGYCGHRLKQTASKQTQVGPAPVQQVSHVPSPPDPPVGQAATPPRRANLGCVWGFISAIALVGLGYIFFLSKGVDQPAQNQPQPTVALSTRTAPPIATSLPTFTPTSITTPTPTPAPYPLGVLDVLSDVQLVNSEGFPGKFAGGAWPTSANGVNFVSQQGGPALEMLGSKGYGTWVVVPGSFPEGQAALFSFSYHGENPDIIFYFDQGTWQTPDYRRFGLYIGQSPAVLILDGKNSPGGGEPLSGQMLIQPDQNYYVLLVADRGGGFLGRIWKVGNPDVYREIRESFPKWAGGEWTLAVHANPGSPGYIDRFYRLSFSGYK